MFKTFIAYFTTFYQSINTYLIIYGRSTAMISLRSFLLHCSQYYFNLFEDLITQKKMSYLNEFIYLKYYVFMNFLKINMIFGYFTNNST